MKQISFDVQFQVFSPEEFFDYVQENGQVRAYRLFNVSINDNDSIQAQIKKCLTSGIDFPSYYSAGIENGQPIVFWQYYPADYWATREQFTEVVENVFERSLNNASKDVFFIPPKIKLD